MKKIVLSAALLFSISLVGSAQSTQKKSVPKKKVPTTTVHATTHQANSTTAHQGSAPTPLDNRKIYEWKNGQRSTPTGEEATGVNSDNYVAGKKDSASKKKLKKNAYR